MPELSRSTAVQQLKTLESDVRLIVLHPNFLAQHSLLNEFLEADNTVYVRLSGNEIKRENLEGQIENALHIQLPDTTMDNVGILILDECDRVESDVFSEFLAGIVSRVGTARVIVISRVVPRCLMGNNELSAMTRFIPSDDTLMLWDYARREDSTALLEVRSFGSGRVLLNGQLVDNWDGLLPRSLFFYLVDRGMTTRNDIFATFWPNLSVREATNVFHVTKRKINEVLGTDLTIYWSGFYRISPDIHLSYDAVMFSEMVQSSQVVTNDDEAIDLLRRAVSLYRGNYLKTINAEWVEKRREELRQEYVEALVGLANALQKHDRIHDALGLFVRASRNSPHREDLVEDVMRLYRSQGKGTDALAAFARLETSLKRNLNITPSKVLQQLAADIRTDMDGAASG